MPEVFTQTDYQDDGKPPRSKALVAYCLWSWSPGNSRLDQYYISGDRAHKEWKLWLKPGDAELGTYWSIMAVGRFEQKTTAEKSARVLLNEAWAAEWKAFESPGPGADVYIAGLLSQDDIRAIEDEIYEMASEDEK